jgi:cobalt/nickel transport protein
VKGAPTRLVVAVGLLAALLLAGVVSHYASSDPDGLNKVAQDKGFAAAQKDHRAGDGPFAGYETQGVGDSRFSGGLAGVVGCVVVLTLAGGVAYAVRRRSPADRS